MIKHLFLSALLAFTPFYSMAVPREQDRQLFEGSARNLLKNPGFEAKQSGWTKTGTSTLAMDSSTPGFGKVSGVWDPGASGEFLQSNAFSIPEGLKARSCSFTGQYKWAGTLGEIKMQVFDGASVLAEVDLDPSTAWRALPPLLFTCPSSGTIQARLESTADAAAISVDALEIGKLKLGVMPPTNVPICTIIASSRTSDFGEYMLADGRTIDRSIYAEYVSNCGSVWGDGDGSTTIHLPDLRGRFLRGTDLAAGRDPNAGSRTAMNSGGNVGDLPGSVQLDAAQGHQHNITTNGASTNNGNFVERSADSGDTFVDTDAISNPVSDGVNGTPRISSENRPVNANVNYFIKVKGEDANEFLTLETSGWNVNANITSTGSDIGFGGPAISSPAGIGSTTLELTNNPQGNIPAKITCDGTEAPSGTTCTGLEISGISFDVPNAGLVEVCHSFSIRVGASTQSANLVFELWETDPANDSTLLQRGYERTVTGGNEPNANEVDYLSSRVCGQFYLASSGTKAFRVKYTKSPHTGTLNYNVVGGAGFDGGGDVNWTARPLSQQMPTPVFTDLTDSLNSKVNSNEPGDMVVASIRYVNTGAVCSVSDNYGLADTVVRVGTGRCNVNFQAGLFSEVPMCTCSLNNIGFCITNNVTASSVSILTYVNSTSPIDDPLTSVICYGKK